MELVRTANAGVLLTMDGTSILLDGVCPPYANYLGTPENLRLSLLQNPPDALAFTHRHPDHYDEKFAEEFQNNTLRPILWAEGNNVVRVGNLTITPVLTRHMGKTDIQHVSFIIEGSRCVWFTGDASPLVWGNKMLPKPDVLIATFAYACSPNVWKRTKLLGAKHIVLLHMPDRSNDPHDLWRMVLETTGGDLQIPKIEEKIII